MTKPVRIQRKRVKGWRMPEGAVYVGRPGKWGNPFYRGHHGTAAQCVELYRKKIGGNLWTFPSGHDIRRELAGKDLACWCPLDQPCHADVLLEIANQ